MQGEHLNDKNGKMSKSNGEFLTLSLLEEKGYTSLVYRLFCLQSHYRNQLVFSYETMDLTKKTYEKLLNKIKNIKENISNNDINIELTNIYKEKFKKSLNNDLNTSNCLTILYDVLKDEKLSNKNKIELVKDFDTVLSLDLLAEKKVDTSLEKYILEMIEKRQKLKKIKIML